MRLKLLFLLMMLVTSPSYGQYNMNQWVEHDTFVKTRLIGTMEVDDNPDQLWVAWEAVLGDGWKTYWRSPGEAGLPVTAEVAGNMLELAYPLPKRFELFGLQTFGYDKHVLIPFKVNKSDFKDGILPVRMGFMVCKDICVPYDSDMTFSVDSLDQSIRIAAWLKKVPHRISDKDQMNEVVLTITSVKSTGTIGHQRLVIDVTSNGRLDQAALFPELAEPFQGGKTQFSLKGDGTSAQFIVPVMTRKKDQSIKVKEIRLTLSNGMGFATDSKHVVQ